MNGRDLFSVGVKLIGVYALVEGVTSLPALLRVIEAHRDWDDFRSSLMLVLTIAVQLAAGWYLIGGAPTLMHAAGFGPPETK